VKKRNPRIVYGSISGFGQYGPTRAAVDRSDRAGHVRDHVGDGNSRQGPLRVGVAVTDIMAGAFLAQGILIALLDAKSAAKAAGADLADRGPASPCSTSRPPAGPGQEGAAAGRHFHPTNTPMGLYPTADGFLNLAATRTRIFRNFCK